MNALTAPRRWRLAALAAAAALAAIVPPAAPAHTSSTYYPHRWANDLQVNWAFTPSGYTSSDWRARVESGFGQWNALAQPMTFVHSTPSGLSDFASDFDPTVCPPVYQRDGIHRRAIDGAGKTLALTYTCTYSTGALYSFEMVFDTGESWYVGTSTPPSTQFDLWSVASHEAGHAAGSIHFSASDSVCTWATLDSTSPYQTMCPYVQPGSTRVRSLAGHDIHTFQGAY